MGKPNPVHGTNPPKPPPIEPPPGQTSHAMLQEDVRLLREGLEAYRPAFLDCHCGSRDGVYEGIRAFEMAWRPRMKARGEKS